MVKLISLLKVSLTIIVLSAMLLLVNDDNALTASPPEVPWEYVFTEITSDYAYYDHDNYNYRVTIVGTNINVKGVKQDGTEIISHSYSGGVLLVMVVPPTAYKFGLWGYSYTDTVALERQPKNPPANYSESTAWSVVQTNNIWNYSNYDHSMYIYSIQTNCSYCGLIAFDKDSRTIKEAKFPTGITYGFLGMELPSNTYKAGLSGYSGKGAYALLRKRKNTLPTLDVSQTLNNQILAAEVGLSKYKIQGFVQDNENDSITVTTEIAGVSKSVITSNTSVSTPFEIIFDVIKDQIPNGIHQVKVTADDAHGGIVTKYLSITVKTRASDNLYITLNDIIYYDTIYSDPESDIQSSERWKFVHNQNFFENPLGAIPDHNVWRGNPYTQFARTGHFKISFQGMDTLSTISEFQKWSRDSFDILNLYVHRKPVPQFTITVYKNATGGFPTIIDDTSYDLDKQSLYNGISESEWSWKHSTSTAWTIGQPPINLSVNNSYDVKLRVKDHQGLWSAPLIQSFTTTGAPTLLNNPPVAMMTNPSGTQAVPTVFTTQKPILTWNQTDPDAATIFKSFEVQVTNEANTVTVFSSGTIAQNTDATTRSWMVTNDLPTGQKLRVRVRVNDGLVWSAWSAQTWMIINRPPVADFDWSPKPVWEGDSVTLTNQSTDLDGDALTYSWNISGPASYTYVTTTTHMSQKFVQPGDYTVRLAVSDGKAQSTMTRTIRVESLTLEADVGYTELWLEHHLSMGHETVTNPKSFYTGEIFVVSAIGSLAATRQVTASLDAIGRDGKSIDISTNLVVTNPANHFHGNLYDPILSSLTGSLPEGQYQINFRIEYMNGVVKEVSIPIRIIGHVQGATNVHRVQ